MYTAISLFSGAVDGLAIAAQAAGFNVTHHIEWDAWCCRVLRMNHPNSIVLNKDIHDVCNLPPAAVIFGGSPCQDFSNAGSGAGFDGKRYLWPEMFRIIRESRPRAVIHENVRGGVSKGLLDRISDDLESEGYEVKALVLPTCVFGAPHERYRMFHIGLLADAKLYRQSRAAAKWNAYLDQKQHLQTSIGGWFSEFHAVESSGEDVADAENGRRSQPDKEKRKFRGVLSNTRDQWERNRPVESQLGGITHGTATGLHRLNPLTDFPGFPAGQGYYQHPYEPPRTTAKKGEYAKERIQALGNAVVWQQAAPIFRAVMRWLEGQGES